MRLMMSILAAALLALTSVAAQAGGKEVSCSETDFDFEAPGYEITCKDFSRSSVSTGQSLAANKSYSLYAYSGAEQTFVDVFSDYIVSATVYYPRRSFESDIEESYTAKFSDWSSQGEIGDYEVRGVIVTFDDGEPMECVGFRKLGVRRWDGINGLTVGLSCSDNGRDKALEAAKLFISQD